MAQSVKITGITEKRFHEIRRRTKANYNREISKDGTDRRTYYHPATQTRVAVKVIHPGGKRTDYYAVQGE